MNDSDKKHKMSKGLQNAIRSRGYRAAIDSRFEFWWISAPRYTLAANVLSARSVKHPTLR